MTAPRCPKCEIELLRNEVAFRWWCILCSFVVTDLQLQKGLVP